MKSSQALRLFGLFNVCIASAVQPSTKLKNATADPMFQLSSDEDFHFELLRVLSLAPYEGADIGEVLVAAKKIAAGDFESFYDAFYDLATQVDETARNIDKDKYPVSARNALFRASSYYRSADFFLHGNWSDPRINSLWDKQLNAFDTANSLLPVPGKRVNLQARDGNFTVPAIFFGTGLTGPRPTILMCNGYDGSQEEMYHLIGKAALERGINVITYEGPGQPTVRRGQNIGFIPEWERVVSPVVDFAIQHPEVDPEAIGLMGYSFGGYLAPRAAAFDKRIAAVFAVDGVYDFGKSLLDQFPQELKDIFYSGDADTFNSVIEAAVADPSTKTVMRWGVQQGMWSFNIDTPFEWLTKALAYNLTEVADKIKQPIFIGDAQLDQFFPGQAKALADAVGTNALYRYFTADEGAGEHCSIGASVLQSQVMLDWFEDVLSKDKE
ncbi:unnamed protein product [Clonostachys rosea]|uniref:Peptidase S9 prolyl oligopeptidase catalytic domain-containing protein n=1 Tax=Bionectria ochroleuca TaxID=29856 RepID=A0ABY6U9J8_BIOOC|nr:unnamed protein product [Clonostachys rosea]